MMRSSVLLALALVVAPAFSHADAGWQAFLESELIEARSQAGLPAIAALVQIDGKIVAQAAIGVRALGHPDAVTVDDRWHIGSDTKAFTATLIARLVERGVMRFDATLADSLPEMVQELDPKYHGVTVRQLLSSTAGLPTLTEEEEFPEFLAAIRAAKGVSAQRAAVVRKYLSMPPRFEIGEFHYSNLGYIVAGVIAEKKTGRRWEDLVREEIFAPLAVEHAGFGAPGTPARVDQPRGHREAQSKLIPMDPADPEADNPPALGPAGTINIALKDWARFAQDQLDGVHGRGKLLETQTYRTLHTPVADNYALGWGVKLGPDGTPALLTHAGSNGYWLSEVRILPNENAIVLVSTNAMTDAAVKAVPGIGKALSARLTQAR